MQLSSLFYCSCSSPVTSRSTCYYSGNQPLLRHWNYFVSTIVLILHYLKKISIPKSYFTVNQNNFLKKVHFFTSGFWRNIYETFIYCDSVKSWGNISWNRRINNQQNRNTPGEISLTHCFEWLLGPIFEKHFTFSLHSELSRCCPVEQSLFMLG